MLQRHTKGCYSSTEITGTIFIRCLKEFCQWLLCPISSLRSCLKCYNLVSMLLETNHNKEKAIIYRKGSCRTSLHLNPFSPALSLAWRSTLQRKRYTFPLLLLLVFQTPTQWISVVLLGPASAGSTLHPAHLIEYPWLPVFLLVVVVFCFGESIFSISQNGHLLVLCWDATETRMTYIYILIYSGETHSLPLSQSSSCFF